MARTKQTGFLSVPLTSKAKLFREMKRVRNLIEGAKFALEVMETSLADFLDPEFLFLRIKNTAEGQSFSIHANPTCLHGGGTFLKLKIERGEGNCNCQENSE